MYGSCFVVQYLVSFANISLGKREREREREKERESWLLNIIAFKCYLTVSVMCLFPRVPWVSLQCVIVAFPGHIYFSM